MLAKGMNLEIWVNGALNQLFIRGFDNRIEFSNKEVVRGQTPFSVKSSFCTPYSICLNNGF